MDLDIPLAPLPEPDVGVDGSSSLAPWGTVLILAIVSGFFLLQWASTPSTCFTASGTATCGAENIVETYPVASLPLLPFLHGNVQHFLSNIVMILLMGIAFERRRSPSVLLSLFFIAAYVSIYADISYAAVTGEGGLAIGASGATRAISGFVVVQYFSIDRGAVTLESVADGFLDGDSIELVSVVIALVAVYATAISIGQYLGFVRVAPDTAYVAHLAGSMIGVSTGFVARLLG